MYSQKGCVIQDFVCFGNPCLFHLASSMILHNIAFIGSVDDLLYSI